MKKISSALLILGLITSLSACSKMESNSNSDTSTTSMMNEVKQTSKDLTKRYGIESGMITYEFSGVKTGKKTVYWDQWGMREATYTESTINAAGTSVEDDSISIMSGEWIYSFKSGEKIGTKIQNTLLTEISEQEKNNDLGEIGYQMMKRLGGVKTGTDTVAGKECEIFEVTSLHTKSCIWEAITLQNQSSIAGFGVSETAVEIKTGSVSNEKFIIPSDITFNTLGNAIEKMK